MIMMMIIIIWDDHYHMDGETDDKNYNDVDDDDRQPTGEVYEVEVEGHLEGET